MIIKYILNCLVAIAFFTSCDAKHIEVPNSEQLKHAIVDEIANKIHIDDTLFLALHRTLAVCGNDERYDGITTPEEKLVEQQYIRDHPYFIDVSNGFDNIYQINGKTIITGSVFDNEFTASTFQFDNDSLSDKNSIYDIVFTKVQKDSVEVQVFDFYKPTESVWNFKMVLMDDKWISLND